MDALYYLEAAWKCGDPPTRQTCYIHMSTILNMVVYFPTVFLGILPRHIYGGSFATLVTQSDLDQRMYVQKRGVIQLPTSFGMYQNIGYIRYWLVV